MLDAYHRAIALAESRAEVLVIGEGQKDFAYGADLGDGLSAAIAAIRRRSIACCTTTSRRCSHCATRAYPTIAVTPRCRRFRRLRGADALHARRGRAEKSHRSGRGIDRRDARRRRRERDGVACGAARAPATSCRISNAPSLWCRARASLTRATRSNSICSPNTTSSATAKICFRSLRSSGIRYRRAATRRRRAIR